ncbi:hypothetical protein ACFY2W_37290 [Streptomyces sp. NPDC001262]|uniref:hypothetical protein n=1 Tax=unclassified Streptomyces TaxID=2593676 RepID=UPI00369B6F44
MWSSAASPVLRHSSLHPVLLLPLFSPRTSPRAGGVVAIALATAAVTALHLPMARIRVRGLVDLVQPPGGGDFARLGEFGVIGTVLAFALVAAARASHTREALWWIVVAALLPCVLEVLDLIPVAALAGVLVPAGWRLRREDRGKVAVLLVTAGTIVMTNLFEGVVAGLLTAAVMAMPGGYVCPWPTPLASVTSALSAASFTSAPGRGMPRDVPSWSAASAHRSGARTGRARPPVPG